MNKTEYGELSAFHPGYYIAEIIEDMGITQEEFAVRMGTTAKTQQVGKRADQSVE